MESKGTWRTVGSLISSIGLIVTAVPLPAIQAWGALIMSIGAAIGGAGVARAAVAGTLFNLKKAA